jgi:hypothetical protein
MFGQDCLSQNEEEEENYTNEYMYITSKYVTNQILP